MAKVQDASRVFGLPRNKLGPWRPKVEQAVVRLHDLDKQADGLASILSVFKEGYALVDEVDMVLHPLRSELNFPIGDKYDVDLGASDSGERWTLVIHLLQAVVHSYGKRSFLSVAMQNLPYWDTDANDYLLVLRDIRAAIIRGVDQLVIQTEPHYVILSPAFYATELRGHFGRWAMYFLLNQTAIADVLSKLGSQLRQKALHDNMLAFISEPKARDKRMAAEHLSSALGPLAVKLLNLARDWVQAYLLHCLSKRNRVDYGFVRADDLRRWGKSGPDDMDAVVFEEFECPLSRKLLAIPFAGKDVPSRSAEFASPEVAIGLTFLAIHYEGMRTYDCDVIVNKLTDNMNNEMGAYSQRPSRIKFNDWLESAKQARQLTPDESVNEADMEALPLELFQTDDKVQMDTLQRVIAHAPDVHAHYLEKLVFPMTMKQQTKKLQASGMDLGSDSLFGIRLGFSGTPSDLLPASLGSVGLEPMSDAMVVHVLTYPKVVTAPAQWYRMDRWTPQTLLDAIAKGGFGAMVDTGALITGFTNEQVARYMTKVMPHMKGCVYWILGTILATHPD